MEFPKKYMKGIFMMINIMDSENYMKIIKSISEILLLVEKMEDQLKAIILEVWLLAALG